MLTTKTKIVATTGPSCSDVEAIASLIDDGVDVFRLNFSHGDFKTHASILKAVNEARSRFTHSIAVAGDLCGPKIRVGKIDPDGEMLDEGDEVTISNAIETGNAHSFGTNYPDFVNDVEVGQRVLINDGKIALGVSGKEQDKLSCHVLIGGPLSSNKGINLPDTAMKWPAITKRDWKYVDWAIENKLDYLALSFVRTADEINHLKDHISRAGSRIKVISKIEKPQAVENLDSIVGASDAVLVARGDLGVEMDFARVPLIQKRITRLCRRLGKPVIIATQMLQSMIESPTASRAEASDVANAIMDFTDAVMLSGETAIGKYPLEAVRTIGRIGKVTEAFLDESDEPRPRIETDEALAEEAAIARSVAQMTDDIEPRLVVVWSEDGQTAQLLSKARIDVPIAAFSSDELICRQMSLHYGVISICKPQPDSMEGFVKLVNAAIIKNGWAAIAERIILVPGREMLGPDTSNALLIHTLSG